MGKYFLKRLAWMIPIVLGVMFIVFTLMYFTPGDPAAQILGTTATEEELANLRHELGIDQPYLTQLATYFKDVLLHFDLGKSYATKVSVNAEILTRLPRTLILTVICMIISLGVGIPLGVTAATHQNGLEDRACMLLALLGVSMPNFWLALLLVIFFAVQLHWLPALWKPALGLSGLKYYILPALSGSTGGIATQARQTRSSMLEVIRSDYITTARAKGVKERDVIYKHALPNALIPIITSAGTQFGHMLGGTLILENIFSIPGLGTYITTAVNARDYPIVRGGVVFLAITFSFCMLAVDMIYAFVDPRIKAQYTKNR